jgi:hypothetical protein
MTDTETVWLVWSGEYDARGVLFVATTLEAAVAHLKAIYATPDVGTWGAVGTQDDART